MVASALRCLLEELVVGTKESSSVMEDNIPCIEWCVGMVLVAIIRLSSVCCAMILQQLQVLKLSIAIRYLADYTKKSIISTYIMYVLAALGLHCKADW